MVISRYQSKCKLIGASFLMQNHVSTKVVKCSHIKKLSHAFTKHINKELRNQYNSYSLKEKYMRALCHRFAHVLQSSYNLASARS